MYSSSQQRHRSFFALPFPASVVEMISALIAELRRHDDGAIRWTPPQNVHLTLRFLGELESEEFVAARNFLLSSSFGAGFRLRLTDVDAFPSPRKPSILVLAVEGCAPDDRSALNILQQRTEEFAHVLGLEPDVRPFRPHVTLGRVRQGRSIPQGLRTFLNATTLKDFGVIEGDFDALVLMESILKPEGPMYSVAAEAKLF